MIRRGGAADPLLEGLLLHPTLRPGGRVLVAMSGGLDSSMAALHLHRAGFEVLGVSMQLHPKAPGGSEGRCCTLDDFQDARRLAQEEGFPHYILDLETQFEAEVIRPFAEQYLHGLTPSPCILCNQFLKFDSLLRHARELGASHLATGHYARVLGTAPYRLHKATDPSKDQSYFLFGLDQEALASVFFPLGGLSKEAIRGRARTLSLSLAEKPESQDICFIPPEGYGAFLEARGQVPRDLPPGEICHRDGRLLGSHPGYWHFTVGQRKGLGIAHPEPLYVLEVQPERNRVVVGEAPLLRCGGLVARGLRWTAPGLESATFACQVKVRSRAEAVQAVLSPHPEGAELRFQDPQPAVAPGQAAVFYLGEELVGGGWIARGLPVAGPSAP